MFPNLLSPSLLTWTGLLGAACALPILIHLINLLRHRRVRWAAMDFLLESHQRNRNWIWLKQFLLLLSRIAALICLLLLIAQVGCRNEEAAQNASDPTHHIIIVDDSLSMGERWAGQTLYQRAQQAVQVIAARAGHRQKQQLSLIRYSRAAANANLLDQSADADSGERVAGAADIFRTDVDSSIGATIRSTQESQRVTHLNLSAESALSWAETLIANRSDQQVVVYLISDFRQNEWSQPTEVARSLERIRQTNAQLRFIGCAKETGSNLSVTDLRPESGMQVAGVQSFMSIEVTNHGTETAENIQVSIQQSLYDVRDASRYRPGQWESEAEELPTVLIEAIEPGESIRRQFPVYFPVPGSHVVSAVLQDDRLSLDNERSCVIDCRARANLLLVEEGVGVHSYYLTASIQPPRGATGIAVSQLNYDALNRLDQSDLEAFDAIVMLDPQRLRLTAVERLETYVRQGGGLAIFLAENSNLTFLNTALYREGDGILPMPLEGISELHEDVDRALADIVPDSDSIFRVFNESRNSPLELVSVSNFVAPPADWNFDQLEGVELLASIRGDRQRPLMIAKQCDAGRSLLVTTSCAPQWNDWATNPAFVVMTLMMTEYLVRDRHANVNHHVGEQHELLLDFDASNVSSTIIPPDPMTNAGEAQLRSDDDSSKTQLSYGNRIESPFSLDTARMGIYEAWLRHADDRYHVVRWAATFSRQESQLELADPRQMESALATSRPYFEYWDTLTTDVRRDQLTPWVKWLLVVVVTVLFVEQTFGYIAGYHRSSTEQIA